MAKKKSPRTSSRRQKTTPSTPVLLDKLALQNVRIVESFSKLNIVAGTTPTEVETVAQAGFGVTDEGTVLGNVNVSISTPGVDYSKEDAKATQSSIQILLTIQCVYSLSHDKEVTPHDITKEESAAINATTMFIAWPYVRAHVQAMSSSMGIPPIILQVVRFGASAGKQ